MNPRVKEVLPIGNGLLKLEFTNSEFRIFDVKPYLDKGILAVLKDEDTFKTVRPFNGTVVWEDGLDSCPDTLYLESVSYQ